MWPMSETLADPMIGRLVDGRYEVRDRVAAGGMATVYRAFDTRLEREVALKVMHRHLAESTGTTNFAARFRREAKAAARLTHPGMVRVYDQGVDAQVPYLTMEFVSGMTLRDAVNEQATLPVGEALDLSLRVLEALSSAHRDGLVHRDIKPENVLIDTDGNVKVTDFGLARAASDATAALTGTILGTVAYVAPEILASGDADARADVYAVGVMLFETLTGRQPFTGKTAIEVASQHVHRDVPAPSQYVPWLPPEIDDLVMQFTSRDPAVRPADASVAAAALRETRATVDEMTLARAAEPPSGAVPLAQVAPADDQDATSVLVDTDAGSTQVLPLGLAPVPEATLLAEYEDDPQAIAPRKGPSRPAIVAAAIVAAILLLSLLGFWWYQTQGPGAYTSVPNVVGQNEDTATAALTALGFEVDPMEEYSDTVSEGAVIRTDPGAQAQHLDGSVVTIFVSLGPELTEVPTIVGETQADAEAMLRDLGFTVGTISTETSDTVPEGTVISQVQSAGEEIRHDSAISFTVSEGPAAITVPDVYGMTEDEAIEVLEGDSYLLDVVIEYARTDEVDTGEVFGQSPSAGASALRTSTITLTVSEGLPLVTVPDVRGIEYKDAKSELQDLGFKVKGTNSPWNFSNIVFEQSLTPETEVEEGTEISLTY